MKSNFAKLVAEVRTRPHESERHYSEVSGIPMTRIGRVLYKAEVQADPTLKISPTPAAIVEAVERGTLRWPRIAAYAGITVAKAKALYEEETGTPAPSNVTPRGRPYGGRGSSTAAREEAPSGPPQRRTALGRITVGGQLSVPVSVRKRWGTSLVALDDQGDQLVVKPLPEDPIGAARGSLSGRTGASRDLRAAARRDEAAARRRR
jgi:hypothetical protein